MHPLQTPFRNNPPFQRNNPATTLRLKPRRNNYPRPRRAKNSANSGGCKAAIPRKSAASRAQSAAGLSPRASRSAYQRERNRASGTRGGNKCRRYARARTVRPQLGQTAHYHGARVHRRFTDVTGRYSDFGSAGDAAVSLRERLAARGPTNAHLHGNYLSHRLALIARCDILCRGAGPAPASAKWYSPLRRDIDSRTRVWYLKYWQVVIKFSVASALLWP